MDTDSGSSQDTDSSSEASGADSSGITRGAWMGSNNNGAADLIDLPPFNPAPPTRANWSYNPKESHIETNRIIRFMKQLMKDTNICSDDIIRAFISRRAKDRFPGIESDRRGPCRKHGLDKFDPDPVIHWQDLKMGRTPASRLGKSPPEPSGSSDDLTLLEKKKKKKQPSSSPSKTAPDAPAPASSTPHPEALILEPTGTTPTPPPSQGPPAATPKPPPAAPKITQFLKPGASRGKAVDGSASSSSQSLVLHVGPAAAAVPEKPSGLLGRIIELRREGKDLGHLLPYAQKWNDADISASTRGLGKDRLPAPDPAGPRSTEEHFMRLKRAVKEFDSAWYDTTSNVVALKAAESAAEARLNEALEDAGNANVVLQAELEEAAKAQKAAEGKATKAQKAAEDKAAIAFGDSQDSPNDISEGRGSSVPIDFQTVEHTSPESDYDDPIDSETVHTNPVEETRASHVKRSIGGFADEDDLLDIDEGFIEPPSKKARSDVVPPAVAASEASAPKATPTAQASTASSLSKGKDIPVATTIPPSDLRGVISSLEAFASQFTSLEADNVRLQEEVKSSSSKLGGAIKKAATARQEVDSQKEELSKLKERLKEEAARAAEKDELLRQSALALLDSFLYQ
nr:uncharacterized protein LOC127315277 [Lolium perenne]